MLTIFEEFYNNKNIPDFLDDDTILINKENNIELKEFLINNHEIVHQMLNYFQYDEYETDHKILIKYPFVISELFSTLNVINQTHITFLFQLLQNTNTQYITIGYITKIFMNLLKNNPILFWSNIELNQLDSLINHVNNHSIQELIYSMIIFQISDNQLEFIQQRIQLVDKLLAQINSNISEGVSQIICMIMQQITETLQEQKSILIKHIFSQINIFLSNFNKQPQWIATTLINFIQHQQYYESEVNQIYNQFQLLSEEFKQQLMLNESTFGINNLAIIQFYNTLVNQQYFIQNIEAQSYIQFLFQLIQKYQYNNQLHKYATNIIIKLLPNVESKQFLEALLLELKQKPIKGNRGYILQIINKIIELNPDIQLDEESQLINKIQNTYLFDVIPDQKPQFNLQEEFEAAMNKLQI